MGDVDSKRAQEDQKVDSIVGNSIEETKNADSMGNMNQNVEEKEDIEQKIIAVHTPQSTLNSDFEDNQEPKSAEELTDSEPMKDLDNTNITKQTASECGASQLIIDRNSCSDEPVNTKETAGEEYVESCTTDFPEGSLNESSYVEMGNQQPGKHKKTGKGNVNKQTASTTREDENTVVSEESLSETNQAMEKVDNAMSTLSDAEQPEDPVRNNSSASESADSDENEDNQEGAYSDDMFDELDNEQQGTEETLAEEKQEESFIDKLNYLADELVCDMLDEEMKNVYVLKIYDRECTAQSNENSRPRDLSPKSSPTVDGTETVDVKFNNVESSFPPKDEQFAESVEAESSDFFELNMENQLNECDVELVLSPDKDGLTIPDIIVTEEGTEGVIISETIGTSEVESSEEETLDRTGQSQEDEEENDQTSSEASTAQTDGSGVNCSDDETSEINEKSEEVVSENTPQITDQTLPEVKMATEGIFSVYETEADSSPSDKISSENNSDSLRSSQLNEEGITEDEVEHDIVISTPELATSSTRSPSDILIAKEENEAKLDFPTDDATEASKNNSMEPIVPYKSEGSLNGDDAIPDDSTASENDGEKEQNNEKIVDKREDVEEIVEKEEDTEEIVKEVVEEITQHCVSVDKVSDIEHENILLHQEEINSLVANISSQILNEIIESLPICIRSVNQNILSNDSAIENAHVENSDSNVDSIENSLDTENVVESSEEAHQQYQPSESSAFEVHVDDVEDAEESTSSKDEDESVHKDQNDLLGAVDENISIEKVPEDYVTDSTGENSNLVTNDKTEILVEPIIYNEIVGEKEKTVDEEPNDKVDADFRKVVDEHSTKESEKSDGNLCSVIDIVNGIPTMEIVCTACGNLLHINKSVDEFPSQNNTASIVRSVDTETLVKEDEPNYLDDRQEETLIKDTDRESERIERLAEKGEKLLKKRQQMEKESLKWKLKPESDSLLKPSTYDGLSSISMLSRASSDDTSGSEPTPKELKDALAELEEKYKQAMVHNAQLDNERAQLNYRVEQLKDTMEEQEEELYRVKAKFKEKCQELEKDKRMYNVLMKKHEDLQEILRQRDELIQHYKTNEQKEQALAKDVIDLKESLIWKDKKVKEQGLVVVGGNGVVMGDSDDGEYVDGGRQYALVTPEAAEVLQSAGDGSLDVQLKHLAEEKRDLYDEVQRLRSELEEVRQNEESKSGKSSSMYPENGAAVDMQLLEIQREAGKQISEYKFKLQKAEQEIGAFQSNVSRLETQLQRYKAMSEVLEKSEDEMRAEKRKLQRDLRASLDRIEEMEMTNAHLEKRLERLRANRAQNTQT